jgi:nucleoside-diphosphate-sugar epimerase
MTSAQAAAGETQLIHEADLASAFHALIQHDLPGAYNVVGDEPDTMPRIAAGAGLQVIEIPHDALVQQVTDAWQAGASTIGRTGSAVKASR